MKGRDTSSKIDWENLRFFLAVARTGSLSRAARMLHTDHSTVRRRVEILEQQVGAQLFYRHARGYDLTSTAEHIVGWVQRMDSGAQGMESILRNKAPAPTSEVRLRCSPILAGSFVRAFAHELPKSLLDIRVEIVCDSEEVGAPRAGTEVTVRCARPHKLELDVQPLGLMPLGLYCGADYLRGHPEPRRVSELSGHDFVDWAEALPVQTVYRELERQGADRRTVLVSDSLELLAASAGSGVGIALLPLQTGDAEPRLKRLLPQFTFGPLEVFILCLPGWHKSWAIRSFVEFVQMQAARFFLQPFEATEQVA